MGEKELQDSERGAGKSTVVHSIILLVVRGATVLLTLYGVLILGGTLFPFDFTTDARLLSGRPHPIEWIPFSYICPHCGFDIKDKILNIIMFMPFGFLLALCRIDKASEMATALRITFWGLAFSLGIEAAQFFLPERTPSASDITLNAFGAFLGAQLVTVITKQSNLLKINKK